MNATHEILKLCNTCNESKQISAFYRTKSNADGYQNFCKSCAAEKRTFYARRKSVAEGRKPRQYTLIARELAAQGLKRCPLCKETKTHESFYDSSSQPDGKASHCIVCQNTLHDRYNTKDKQKQRYKQNKTQLKDKALKRKFGLTLEDYEAKLKMQNGSCAVCHEQEEKALAVDHNHQTGKIRDLLCSRCNIAIGMLRDDPELMRQCALYIERHNKDV